MSQNEQQDDAILEQARVIRRKRHNERSHHPRHFSKRHLCNGESCWIWILLFVVISILAVWIVGAFVRYPYYVYPASVSPEQTDTIIEGPFVFRKRIRREQCRTGEFYDVNVKMCAPIEHKPMAFDPLLMNGEINPCDSLYDSLCGKWNSEHVNEDRTFSYGYYRNQNLIKQLITSDTGPISRFFESCKARDQVKESEIEYKHITEYVLGDVKNYADLPAAFGRLARLGYTSPFVFSIERHPTSRRLVPFFSWDGFKDMDLSRIIAVMITLRPITRYTQIQITHKADRVWKVIQGCNQHNTDPIDDIDDFVQYIQQKLPGHIVHFDTLPTWKTPYENKHGWSTYFQSLDGSALRFVPTQDTWVIGLGYINWLFNDAMPHYELGDWIAYIEFSIMYNSHQFIPLLPNNVYFKQWDSHGPLTGAIYHRIPREENVSVSSSHSSCYDVTQHMIPGLVAEEFLKTMEHKKEIRIEVKQMAQRILSVYENVVNQTKWMSDNAKQIAIQKIRNVIVRVAEPDEWTSEPFADRISGDRYDHNMNLVRKYRVQRNVQLWHKDKPDSLDRNAISFFSAPLTDVNAYYSGPTNTITILAGILQKPFYNLEYNQVSKHAILGFIIGHELGHVLDQHGMYWDLDGSFVMDSIYASSSSSSSSSSYSPIDGRREVAKFVKQVKCVIEEFSPAPSECESGRGGEGEVVIPYGNATLNEDLADKTGLRLSYNAYFYETPEGRAAPMGDKQHFFFVLAQTWCASIDRNHTCARVASDVHALPSFRVDKSAQDMPEYQRALNCHAGQRMFRVENEMCIVF